MSAADANLAVQGYRLSSQERRSLGFGLQFPTALCLVLVVTGLALQSAVMILALVPIGAVAGWTARHPFDLLWNHGLRRLFNAPPLPPNPTPRRHAFKLAWLAIGLEASLVGYMVTSFFASVATQWYAYYLVAYALCLHRIIDSRGIAETVEVRREHELPLGNRPG